MIGNAMVLRMHVLSYGPIRIRGLDERFGTQSILRVIVGISKEETWGPWLLT